MSFLCKKILAAMGYGKPLACTQLQSEEDQSLYNVWRVDYEDRSFILKQAKGEEISIYHRYLAEPAHYAPQLFAAANVDGNDYLLMEYIPGNNLMRCDGQALTLAVDALIAMQMQFKTDPTNRVPESRVRRRNWLENPRLERAYDAYMELFSVAPCCFCHDDLLPFNVLISGDRAVFIDWEVADVLPYPTSLARLIAHGEENENALFYMKNTDKLTAIDYFYNNFVRELGIERAEYDRTLALCLFHEYCEWVYVGHKYGETDTDRYKKYLKLALKQAEKFGF